MLRNLATSLESQGVVPILLAPPLGYLDAAPLAFTQMVCQFSDTLAPLLMEKLRDPRIDVSEKSSELESLLEDNHRKIVILCDEPTEWLPRTPERASFSGFQRALSSLLFHGPRLRVVVAGALPPGLVATESLEMNERFDSEHWLLESVDWPKDLIPFTQRLMGCTKLDLSRRTPLEIRLLVGMLAMGRDVGRLEGCPRRMLSEEFRRTAQADQRWSAILYSWARLALLRTSFSERALVTIGAPEGDTEAGRILRHCLLYETDEGYILHELLRSDVQRDLTLEEQRETHRAYLDSYFLPTAPERALAPPPAAKVARFDSECFYHAMECGDVDLATERAYYIEQLKLLGRTLSFHHKRYSDAAAIFAEILEKTDDAYSHHYYAYNLDIQARQPGLVEKHYRLSLSKAPRNHYWWSRWICFLLTRGRTVEAEREWNVALDAMSADIPEWDSTAYRTLHGRVLLVALYRSCLEFAARVLETIPEGVLERESDLLACERRLKALQLARAGKALVPYPLICEEWWEQGPFLIPRSLENGHKKPLTRWMAARVESIDESTVELRLGEILPDCPGDPEVRFGGFPKELLEDWGVELDGLGEGDFLEVGAYGEGEADFRAVKHSYYKMAEADFFLMKIFPEPNRYLAGA